jgi:hypothetical protein
MVLIIFIAATGMVMGAETCKHSAFGLSFETPVPFSAPRAIGLDALALHHPLSAEAGQENMEIVLVSFNKGALDAHTTTEGDLANYVKSTFLAAGTDPGKSIHRVLLGKEIMGELCETSIPKASIIEIYPLTLKNGSKVVIAFKRRKEMSAKDAESVISTAAKTIKER